MASLPLTAVVTSKFFNASRLEIDSKNLTSSSTISSFILFSLLMTASIVGVIVGFAQGLLCLELACYFMAE
jgi:hypothetical protein